MIQSCVLHGWSGELILGPGGGCPDCKAHIRESEQVRLRDRIAEHLRKDDRGAEAMRDLDERIEKWKQRHHNDCDIYDRPPEYGRPAIGANPCNCYVQLLRDYQSALAESERQLGATKAHLKHVESMAADSDFRAFTAKSELEAANRKIEELSKLEGCELHKQMLEVMNHQNLEWTEEYAKLELRAQAAEERLRVAVETISSLERIVPYHEDCHDPCPLKGAHKLIRTALAKLKPTAEKK